MTTGPRPPHDASSASGPHVREQLSAYVDDELPPAEARAVADHLTSCDECSAAYQETLATVSRLREELVHYTAPDTLRARVRASLREASRAEQVDAAAPPSVVVPDVAPNVAPDAVPDVVPNAVPRRRATWRWSAAAALLLAAGSSGATLFATNARRADERVERDVVASHIRSLMPDHLTDVQSNDQHNVKPWFNGRLDFSPTVPRLDSLGFPLLGGRLDYVGGRPVAVVVYGRRRHVINAYAWPAAAGDAREALDETNGYHALHWRSAGVEHWVVSDLNAAELGQFTALLRGAVP